MPSDSDSSMVIWLSRARIWSRRAWSLRVRSWSSNCLPRIWSCQWRCCSLAFSASWAMASMTAFWWASLETAASKARLASSRSLARLAVKRRPEPLPSEPPVMAPERSSRSPSRVTMR
ncbi:hypothetical protein D3C72_1761120 [compost metagenome]